MSLINQFSALLIRGNALAIDRACCCPECCGLPTNCTLCAHITFFDNTSTYDCFNQSTGLWRDGATGGPPFFMPAAADLSAFVCTDAYNQTQDPKFLSCCVRGEFSETPYIEGCVGYVVSASARFVCDQCCGEPTNKAIGCRIEDQLFFSSSNGNDCAQFYPNIYFTLECTDENCNPFP